MAVKNIIDTVNYHWRHSLQLSALFILTLGVVGCNTEVTDPEEPYVMSPSILPGETWEDARDREMARMLRNRALIEEAGDVGEFRAIDSEERIAEVPENYKPDRFDLNKIVTNYAVHYRDLDVNGLLAEMEVWNTEQVESTMSDIADVRFLDWTAPDGETFMRRIPWLFPDIHCQTRNQNSHKNTSQELHVH